MKVMIVRLITGEELIGSWDSDAQVISSPLMIAVGSNPLNNQLKVQLVPWGMFTRNDSFRLKDEHVMYVEEPDEQIYNRYTQATGIGIQLPETGKIQLAG
jgi:hypothetical protein